MNPRLWWVLGFVVILALLIVLLWPRESSDDPILDPTAEADPTAEPELEAEVPNVTADLYFPGRSGWLHAESREVPASSVAEEQIAHLIQTLIAGPHDRRLAPPLPENVTVREVYLVDDKAFLDLESPAKAPPSSGSQQEILAVYSLVNTVLLNPGLYETEGLARVVLLWNGQQPMTFAGHLNTARPFAANSGLVARPD